jgi:hypothetical protein
MSGLDDIKRSILERHEMEELLNPGARKERNKKLAKGLRDVPINKIMQHIQHIEKAFLPAVAKKSGKNSADYIFFSDLIRDLSWAVVIADRYDFLASQHTDQKITIQLQRENLRIYEAELAKYNALEDIFLMDAFSRYFDGVKAKIAGNLNLEK